MVRLPLGRSGINVSPIALGTVKLGRNTDVKYPNHFVLPSVEESRALLAHARQLGVNLIDTAPAYGASEEKLGRLIGGYRQQLVLCTKCGEQYSDGYSSYDFSLAAIIASVDASLRRLRTDYIDILLLHSNGADMEILTQTDAVVALDELKKAGKVRATGISAKTASGILEACNALDIIMAPFSQKDPSLGDALKEARQRGLGILAVKGLFSGHLNAAPAIEFVLRQSFIDALVIGTINPAHLGEAVAVAERLEARSS